MRNFTRIFALLCISLSMVAAVNECGQYTTCRDCLNITAGHDTGGRTNCGWCHVNIAYKNGTTGKRCADIRDDPWHCRDQYDTYKCSVGWKCDETSGQCKPDMAGEGYGSNSTCSQYCNPHPHKDTYRCNTTTYTCDKCTNGTTTGCGEKTEACKNCEAPPESKWKCNKTDPKQPKCEECKGSSAADPDCKSRQQACQSCHPPQKMFSCDKKTLTCKEGSGQIKAACDSSCGHFTPTNLLGVWRGLEVKKGHKDNFLMGEIDMIFGEKNLTVVYPNATQDIYDVSTTGGGQMTLTKDDVKINVAVNELSNLKHTIAMGLSTFGPGQDAPASFREGMISEKALSSVMWKCTSYGAGAKGKCSFNQTDAETLHQLAFNAPLDIDECNKYTSCHPCINASTPDGIECGWCLGGTLNYKGVGNTTFKCGGFKAGQPHAFTCPAEFRTTDCSGFNCNFTSHKCSQSEQGQFPTMDACNKTCSMVAQYKKCNHTTKKCETCDHTKDPDCKNTGAHCEATCNVPHAKCNETTGKCAPCDPAKDKNCTDTQGSCGTKCQKKTKSKCDHSTGKCNPCTDGQGCVNSTACDATCKKVPTNETYACDWSKSPPTCKQDPKGTLDKKSCTDQCKAPSFGKCDFKTGECVECKQGDPKCVQTLDVCKVANKEKHICKAQTLEGLYRMIEVNPKYKKGEFDLMFKDGKLYMQDYDTKVEAKELGTVKTTGSTDAGGVTFEVTGWKADPAIWPFTTLFGVYQEKPGEAQTFDFLEMAFGEHHFTKLDDGLTGTGKYWVGVKCHDVEHCDFAKASPAMQWTPRSDLPEKAEFMQS